MIENLCKDNEITNFREVCMEKYMTKAISNQILRGIFLKK